MPCQVARYRFAKACALHVLLGESLLVHPTGTGTAQSYLPLHSEH